MFHILLTIFSYISYTIFSWISNFHECYSGKIFPQKIPCQGENPGNFFPTHRNKVNLVLILATHTRSKQVKPTLNVVTTACCHLNSSLEKLRVGQTDSCLLLLNLTTVPMVSNGFIFHMSCPMSADSLKQGKKTRKQHKLPTFTTQAPGVFKQFSSWFAHLPSIYFTWKGDRWQMRNSSTTNWAGKPPRRSVEWCPVWTPNVLWPARRWLHGESTKWQLVYLDYVFVEPIGSMYRIFTYIWLIFMVNVGKYTIHGSYGQYIYRPRYVTYICTFWYMLIYI